jgi:1-acyl-sn-glycerol-3-phosphate acyltransferase
MIRGMERRRYGAEGGAVARRRLGFWRRLAVVVVKAAVVPWTRRDWAGLEHVPREGGVIFAPNHLSHADPLIAAYFVYDAGRWPHFLAKSDLFAFPVLGWLLRMVRQIPVHRGTADAAKALDAAVEALKRGEGIIIYPEGTTTAEPQLWPMKGKTGVARLALVTGAPVIPVVLWGPQQMFDPRTRRLSLRPRIPVRAVAGPPVDLTRWAGVAASPQALYEMTDAVMLRLRDMLAEVRGERPPPLWTPSKRSSGTAGEREATA